jgi:hypothetical protein
MKPKKLTFMNIKSQELTREEMRNVMAGCGGCGCAGPKCHGADSNCTGDCVCGDNSGPGDNSVCVVF